MKIGTVLHILSFLLIFLSATLLLPLFISLYSGEKDTVPFIASIIITLVSGGLLYLFTKRELELGIRESFGIVTFGWLLFSFFGSLPLFFYGREMGNNLTFVNSFFEIMSGITTTGASILTDIESMPRGILFWRSLTHWFGGMGIIVLTLAILPLIGVGGVQLFQAESPGPVSDKIRPKIKDTAKILWVVYLFLTVVQVILYYIGGMELFDSLCHAFGTMATGGFSTKSASIGAYNSKYIELVTIAFMFIAGANFTLHYQALKGKPIKYFNNAEFKIYSLIIFVFTIFIAIDLIASQGFSFGNAFLDSLFQVVAIGTTTGYSTADYETWSQFSRMLLFTLMFIGGCGGSTGGGIKVIRVMILFKFAFSRMKTLIHPQGVFRVKIGGKIIREHILYTVSGFFILFFIILITASLAISFLGVDFETSISSVVACLGNIGPGLGGVGPTDNYDFLPATAKWILILCMLLGRLEIYTVMLLFVPETWKK